MRSSRKKSSATRAKSHERSRLRQSSQSEVVLRQRVAEVVLDARAAGHQRAPQRVAADVVRGRTRGRSFSFALPEKPSKPGSGGTPRAASPCSSFATTQGFPAFADSRRHFSTRWCAASQWFWSDAPVRAEPLPRSGV